jgi:hypothetical protein
MWPAFAVLGKELFGFFYLLLPRVLRDRLNPTGSPRNFRVLVRVIGASDVMEPKGAKNVPFLKLRNLAADDRGRRPLHSAATGMLLSRGRAKKGSLP